MSCETNANKVGGIAGVKAGIGAAACKFNRALGALVENAGQAVTRAGQAIAPASETALDFVDRQGFGASLMRSKAVKGAALGAAIAAAIAADQRYQARPAPRSQGGNFDEWMEAMGLGRRPSGALARAALVADLVGRTSARLGHVIGQASRQEQVGATGRRIAYDRIFGIRLGETWQKVPLFKSSMTGLLGKLDWLGIPQAKVRSNAGVVFETNGRTWHRGTSVADTPDGKRTITHLQSLSIPATHYYFNRPIGDEQAVDLANEKLRPETLPGYVGALSRFEGLTPGWGGVKHAMIKTALFYGRRSSGDAEPAPAGASAKPAAGVPQIQELEAKMGQAAGDRTEHR
jgi:hypothetical protein